MSYAKTYLRVTVTNIHFLLLMTKFALFFLFRVVFFFCFPSIFFLHQHRHMYSICTVYVRF